MPEFPAGRLSGQRERLLAFLDFHRQTLLWKVSELDADGLRQRSTTSTMTLAGLLKHCAIAEVWWFQMVFAGQPAPAWFASVDWQTDENWEWTSALSDPPDELRLLYCDAIARSDALIADADLEDLAKGSSGFAGQPTLHWILLHVTTETARHAGHADLIREGVDGRVGWRGDGDI